MTTATDILTQLEELWEGAEPGPFEAEDAIILKYADGTYAFRSRAGYRDETERIRVVERAKPKAPEWEAVVASYTEDEEHRRQVFTRNDWGKWESATHYATTDELVDPVSLVEMPEREALADALEKPYYAQGGWSWPGSYPLVDAVLELLRGER